MEDTRRYESQGQPNTRPAWRSAWEWLKSSHIPARTIFDAPKSMIELSLVRHTRELLERAYPIDGEDLVRDVLTTSNGVVLPYPHIPFGLTVAAFFGLPCRPIAIFDEDGNPCISYTFRQFLFDLAGGWNIVNETITGEATIQPVKAVTEEDADSEYGSGKSVEPVKPATLSFSQKRWTEKKIFSGLVLLFKILVIVPFKIISGLLKFALNIVKLVTEVFIPLLTGLLAMAANKLIGYTGSALWWTLSYDEERRTYGFNPLKFLFGGIATIIVASVALVTSVVQYALLWASRFGLALTSPDKSARLAFHAGKKLLNNGIYDYDTESYGYNSKFQKGFSYFVAGFLFVASLATSALLWMITLPLALGTLTTIFPSIITAIQWVAQLPFVTATLTWFTQWPVVAGSVALVNSLFGTVGVALASVFGPALTTLAALIHVQVPAAVALVGLTLGFIVTPVASLLSRGLDALSDAWAKWVEQAPVTTAIAWLKSCVSGRGAQRNKEEGQAYELLEQSKPPAQEPAKDPCPAARGVNYWEVPTIYVYQAFEGQHYIVGDTALNLTRDKDALEADAAELLNGIRLTGAAAKEMWSRSNPEKVARNGLTYQGARRATQEEKNATREAPAEPHDIYEEPKQSCFGSRQVQFV